jgi:Arc/MetJ-type ribon-helix-helix transcriptional regulator
MTTLSIPVSATTVSFINRMVKRGVASTKAEVVRQALARYEEDSLLQSVLRAQQDLKDGKEVRGNLREILKQMK